MAKINLNNIVSGFNLAKINDNFQKIATALNDKVLWRDNPVGEPNQMNNDLDMNGKHIYNLPAPTSENEPARLKDVNSTLGLVEEAVIAAQNAQHAAEEAAEIAENAANVALDLFSKNSILPNHLWAGFFKVWQQGGALKPSGPYRQYISDGATYARQGFANELLVLHSNNSKGDDSALITRAPTDTSTAFGSVFMGLTQAESAPLMGKTVTLQFDISALEDFSGASPTVRLQYSLEPEQIVMRDDGKYTNGHVLAAEKSGFGTIAVTAFIPSDAINVGAHITIPFGAGAAGALDGVEVSRGYLTESATVIGGVSIPSFETLKNIALSRYWTTYPYGSPRGSLTEQGSRSIIAIGTTATWAMADSIQFSVPMVSAPVFYFQSTVSGTESRFTDTVTKGTLNGLAYNISNKGVTVTNNAVPTAARRYLYHATAIALV